MQLAEFELDRIAIGVACSDKFGHHAFRGPARIFNRIISQVRKQVIRHPDVDKLRYRTTTLPRT
jgi:hypothetical protein